ncbi:MAG: hypothetical protein ACYTF6_09655, partial [Planctomycetota bacterium]
MGKSSLLLASWSCVLASAAAADNKALHIPPGREQSLKWHCKDSAGYNWDITKLGQVNDGTNDAYDGGMRLTVNGNVWNWTGKARLSEDGREIEIGPHKWGALAVSRRIYVDDKIGYCRWIDIFENPSVSPKKVDLQYHSNMGSSSKYTYTTSGKAELTDADWGIVTSNTKGSSARPATVHVFATADSNVKPRFQFTRNNDNLYYRLSLEVPARGAVALCLIEAQRRPYSEAVKFLNTFRVEAELRKVPSPLRRIMVNMRGAMAVMGTLELPRKEKHDLLVKRDGEELLGTIQNALYVVEASFGRLELPADRVVGLGVPSERGAYIRLGLTDGAVIGGKLLSGPIKFTLADGKEVSLPAKAIRTVSYRLSPERPAEIAVGKPMAVLRSGERLFFRGEDRSCSFRSEYGDVELSFADVRYIEFDTPSGGLHRVVFSNGSVLSGLVVAEEFKLGLDVEETVMVPRHAVKKIKIPQVEDKPGPLAKLTLKNEDLLLGRIAEESLSVKTPDGEEVVNPSDVAEILFAADSPLATVSLKLHNGKKLSGRLTEPTIRFRIEPGPVVPVFAGHVVRITCPKGLGAAEPGAGPAPQPAEKKASSIYPRLNRLELSCRARWSESVGL